MIERENFPNAYSEIHEILIFMDDDSKSKIPKDFMDMIDKKRNREYKFKIDETKDLQNQNILRETKVILGYIFANYLGSEEQQKKVKRKMYEDIQQEEQQKRAKYNVDIFKDNGTTDENYNEHLDNMPVPVNKQHVSVFSKIKKFITNLFNKRKA